MTNKNAYGGGHNHGDGFEAGQPAEGHDYYSHVSYLYPELLAPMQERYGGYSRVSEKEIVAQSSITGLYPVIEQAISDIKNVAANNQLSEDDFESKVAQRLTQLNDWENLTALTQAKIEILSGVSFSQMTAAEREETINHLLHSPLPFGDIDEVLTPDTTIYMSYTHTLDKNETMVTDMGDGLFKISMISNNNNGSHTGHNLGSFQVQLDAETTVAEAKAVGNAMVVNENNNDELYLAEAAKHVLHKTTDENDTGYYDETGQYVSGREPTDGYGNGGGHDHDGEGGVGQGHDFVSHVKELFPELLAEDQSTYGGYTWVGENEIVARSSITGLLPVIQQAIAQVKTAQPNLEGQALEAAVAQQLTQLNDWENLTALTQAKIEILSGINFSAMSTAEREETINHLLHSPLPFGDIATPLDTDTRIYMEYTHTLDKNQTTAEHMGDGVYKVMMISNNNNGSHTGHNLGSFQIDLSGYDVPIYATSASASSNYSGNTSTLLSGQPDGGTWWPGSTQVGDVTVSLGFASARKVHGVELVASTGYPTGHVTKVEVMDVDGVYHTVWTGDVMGAAGQRLKIEFDETAFDTKDVRVTIDTNKYAGWEGLDAVALLGDSDDKSGLEDLAVEVGNGMVINTNNNNKLYLDQAAQNVLHDTDHDKGHAADGMYDDGEDGDGGQDGGYTDGQRVHIHGNSTDYGWGLTEDKQGVVLWKGDWFRIFDAKVVLEFHDTDVDTAQLFDDGGDGDRATIDGNSSDYGWGVTEDGEGVVVWNGDWFRVFEANVVLVFNDKEVDTSPLFGGGENDPFTDDPNQTQYVFGTDGEDTFVVNGNASDYGWGQTEDGTGYVVWNDTGFDVLYDVEKVQFDDMEVSLAEAAA